MECQAWKGRGFHSLEATAVVSSELSECLFYLKECYCLNVLLIIKC